MAAPYVADLGLTTGTPTIKSVGPIAFGSSGILFVADNISATITAIEVAETGTATAEGFDLENLDTKLASLLGCSPKDLSIRDIAVHPHSQNIYVAVNRYAGNGPLPVLVKIDVVSQALSIVSLANVRHSQTTIEGAPTERDDRKGDYDFADGRFSPVPMRASTVTDMAYVDGVLLIAGLSNEEFASTLRRIPFPFKGEQSANSLEIFHVSHGRYETNAPIRSFVPYREGREIIASYTCTPVVKFSLADLEPGKQVKGVTVADLGSRNLALDMVAFAKDGEQYVLVSNSHHPLMKLSCADIDGQVGLTQPKEPLGIARTNLPHAGVSRMANLSGSFVLMMQREETGAIHLRSASTASL